MGGAILERLKQNKQFEVKGTFSDNSKPGMEKLDITDKQQVFPFIKKEKPDVVVLAAAWNAVDAIEQEKEKAWKINVEGVKNVADACRAVNARLVYTSTYFVFDGKKLVYSENDKPNPLNYYSVTKMEAEKIAASLPDSLIVRLTNVFSLGYDEYNVAERVARALKKREQVKLPMDVGTNAISADNLAQAVEELLLKKATGIWNIGGSEFATRYDVGVRIARAFGLDEKLVVPVKSAEAQKATRPALDELDCTKFKNNMSTKLLDINAGIELAKKRYKP